MGGYRLSDWLRAWRESREGPVYTYLRRQQSSPAAVRRRRWTLTAAVAALFILLLALERWVAGGNSAGWPQAAELGGFAGYFGWFIVPIFVLYCSLSLADAAATALRLLARHPEAALLRLDDELALSRQGPLDVLLSLQRLLQQRLLPLYMAGLLIVPLHLYFILPLSSSLGGGFSAGLPTIFSPLSLLTLVCSTALASITVVNVAVVMGRGLRSSAALLLAAGSYALLAPVYGISSDLQIFDLSSGWLQPDFGVATQLELMLTAAVFALGLLLSALHASLRSRLAAGLALGLPTLAILGCAALTRWRFMTNRPSYSEIARDFEQYFSGALLWAGSWALPLSPMAAQGWLGPEATLSRQLLHSAMMIALQAACCWISSHYALAALRDAGLRDSRDTL